MSFEAYGYVFGYDFDKKIWIYDCKYFLKDGYWYYRNRPTEKAMPLTDRQLKTMLSIQQTHPEKEYKMDDCVVVSSTE